MFCSAVCQSSIDFWAILIYLSLIHFGRRPSITMSNFIWYLASKSSISSTKDSCMPMSRAHAPSCRNFKGLDLLQTSERRTFASIASLRPFRVFKSSVYTTSPRALSYSLGFFWEFLRTICLISSMSSLSNFKFIFYHGNIFILLIFYIILHKNWIKT